MNFSFVDPWHLFLPRDGGHVVSIMGSGGKTSLQRAFSQLYVQENIPTILTTTTRTEPWDDIPVMDLSDLSDLTARAGESLPQCFYLKDGTNAEGKWRGLDPLVVDRLGNEFPDRVVLVEVDGSAKLPMKLYQEGEPAWPGRTSLAVLVMGAQAAGSFVNKTVHRLGRRPSVVLDELPAGAILEWDHILELLRGDGGYLDQVPEDVPTILALGGMAEVVDSIGLFDFVGKAMEDPRLPISLFFETSGDEPSFRTGCRQESAEIPDPDPEIRDEK